MVVNLEMAKQLVEFMNSVYEIDPTWCQQICETKFDCNEALADHPTIQAWRPSESNPLPRVGFVGLINGFLGAYDDGAKKGAGAFCTKYDDAGKFLGFGINENIPKLDE